jgi:hypothetical protein
MAIKRSFILSGGLGVSADNIFVVNSTNSTSSTTGSIISIGGIGIGQSASISGRLQLFNSSNYTAFVSSASGNTVYTLPATSPATGSSVLQSTSAGVMSWVPMVASGAASGFTTLNTLTDGIQYFATGISGSGFNISSSGSTHTFNIPIAGSGSTGLITTLAQTIAGQKTFSSALYISDTTASTGTSVGALQVAGGVGISGKLSFNQASFGTTGIATNPTMAMIGQTGDPIYMSVLEDNSISFEGTQGQLFSITPNLSTGYIYSVNDITGIPLIRANANANVTANEYAGNFGIGLTNPGYKLHVLGAVGFTSTTVSTSSTTGTLVVGGGVGIGGSLYVASATAISGVTINNGIITGNLTGTATTSGFATTSNYSNQSGYGITAGFATTATNINVVSASTNANHQLLFTPTSGSASGIAVSTESSLVYNPSTDILTVSGLAITSGTASTNTTTGALVVRGGLGITGQLSFAQASFGFTGITTNPTMSFIGATSASPITLTVLTDNSLNFEGSQGSVFSIDSNLSSGEIFSVSDISGLPIISASAGQTVNINEFGGYTQIGNGSINSTSTTTGSLIVAGGMAITSNASIGGRLQLFNSSNYTAFVSSASGNTVYTLPATSPATGTSYLISNSAGVMSWVAPSKANYVLSFGAGFTPASNSADSVSLNIPYAPDGTIKYYFVKRIEYRNETLSGGTGLSFYLQRHTTGNASWSTTNTITAGSGASFEVGASVYSSSFTTINSSSGIAGSIISGDYVRLFFTTVGSAANVSIAMTIEEQ